MISALAAVVLMAGLAHFALDVLDRPRGKR